MLCPVLYIQTILTFRNNLTHRKAQNPNETILAELFL